MTDHLELKEESFRIPVKRGYFIILQVSEGDRKERNEYGITK